MSKLVLDFPSALSTVHPRAIRHAAARTARAGGVALTLALAGLSAGCSTVHDNERRAPMVAAQDRWLGAARSSAGSPESTFDVQLDARATSPEAPGQSHFLLLTGTWTFTKASKGSGRQVLAQLKLTRLELSDDHALAIGKDAYQRRIRAELERPVLFDLNERGAVIGMHAPRDLVSTALGAIQMLAANFQLTVAPAGAGKLWTAQEQDTSGTYAAEYRVLDAGAVVRKKLRYTELPAPEAGSAPVNYEIQNSESRFTLSPSGTIASCSGSESLVLDDHEGALPRLETKTTFRIVRRADTTRKELPEPASQLRALPARALNALPEPEGSTYEIDLAKAANGTRIDDILEDMARTDPARGSGDPHAFRRLVASLEAAVRLDHDAEDAAFARVEGSEPYKAEILTALARSNRPQTLVKVAERLQASAGLAEELRVRALVALSTNASATRPVVEGVEALTSDPRIGQGAVLGLGALSYRLQRTNPQLSQQIYESLAALLDRAKTPAQIELALRAIGNAGNHASLPKIERFLVAPEPKLRAVAVGALRRLEDSEVTTLLAEIEKNDKDEAVQDAVRTVLSHKQGT